MTSSTTPPDAARAWQEWHEGRLAAVTGPYGPLALAGTHWLADHPDGRIDGLPGRWTAAADGTAVVLEAAPGDGLTVDGAPAAGVHRLDQDAGPAAARVRHGARRLVVLHREGLWAVRDFDPESPARRAFAGLDAHPYDERWVRPGLFRPYAARRTVQVTNADGRERGLVLGGELAFTLDGDEHTLQVAVEPDGSLWAVLADAGSGTDGYRFRFLRPPAPAADGTVPVDLNRTQLPPCAFADHFLCPFPPPGNTLPFALRAGERSARFH
ncbi:MULTISPECIES: DUF1684 domain-containing protein [unclassified Streptomyces]|uniref:DUF1684 domain-containing protein n=1 Tax=unclassified Streptomyces TaxID=2593676 RepID=UPI000369E5C0|nr:MULTISPECIES: DUF1684 domain-containing protein [unclassified Streptomyces]MYT29738.1 DUF1684 domain-containing protein [Streptomyces sp. SID8354]